MTQRSVNITVVAGLVALWMFGVTGSLVAQDEPEVIQYGDTVTGQITDEAFEIEYTFEGTAEDVVIVRMDSDESDDALETPAFLVFSARDRIIDSTRIFTLSVTTAYAVFPLASDGTYSLVATRRDGQAGVDGGGFILSLKRATPLEIGQPLDGEASDEAEQYHVIEPDGAFTLSYTKTGGRFSPAISVSGMQPGGALDPVADLSGRSVDAGTITITPDRGVRYLVRVGKAFLSQSTGDVQYTLTVSSAE